MKDFHDEWESFFICRSSLQGRDRLQGDQVLYPHLRFLVRMPSMKALLIFSLLSVLLAPKNSAAAGTTEALPRAIIEMQNISAVQGTCQKEWLQMTETFEVTKQALDDRQTIYIVPCALWAANVAYSVFITIRESSHPDGFLTKAIRFVNYSSFEGVVARDLIHNIKWDSATKTLKAQYFINGSEICGSKSEYKWHAGYQTLLTKTLLKQDDCKNAQAPWLPVFN